MREKFNSMDEAAAWCAKNKIVFNDRGLVIVAPGKMDVSRLAKEWDTWTYEKEEEPLNYGLYAYMNSEGDVYFNTSSHAVNAYGPDFKRNENFDINYEVNKIEDKNAAH